MEKCHLHDQLAAGAEGTRQFSFDCETGDGASGGAIVMGTTNRQFGDFRRLATTSCSVGALFAVPL